MVRRNITYKPYPLKEVDVDSLWLDEDNVRIPESIPDRRKQEILRRYLTEKEGVLDLVSQFLHEGYVDNEQPVVVLENQRYVVLEGNRRVCALILLHDPSKAEGNVRIRIEDMLDKENASWGISRVNVQVCPSREEFGQTLARIHTQRSKKPWPRDQIAQFYYEQIKKEPHATLRDLKKRFPDHAQKIDGLIRVRSIRESIFSCENKYDTWGYSDLRDKIHNTQLIPFSSMEYAVKKAWTLLNLEFNPERGLLINPTDSQIKGLLELSRMICDKEFNTRREPKDFNQRILHAMGQATDSQPSNPQDVGSSQSGQALPAQPHSGTQSAASPTPQLQPASEEPLAAHPSRTAKKPYLDNQSLTNLPQFKKLPEPVRDRITELGRLRFEEFKYSCALLTRNILEMVVLYFSQQHSIPPESGLDEQLKSVEKYINNTKLENVEKNRHIKRIESIRQKAQIRNSPLDLIGLADLNNVNHDLSTALTGKEVVNLWKKVQEMLTGLLQIQ